ncbi:MAG: diguanylate cyclase [Chloroflexi bacterium]|nr:diguanylate cyclase [Chloroflexota bacterium]
MLSARSGELHEISGRNGFRDRLWANTPLSSVKGRIIIGFGMVTLLLVGVIGATTWQAQVHQSALTELEDHSKTASLLQTAEANAAVTGLLLQRYVISGDEVYVAEIQEHADVAQASMNEALTRGNVVGLDAVYAAGTLLVQDAARTTQLRLTDNVAEAEALIEQIVPLFREYRLQLEALAASELDQVHTLREQANSTAQLTVLLLIALGAIGGTLIITGGYLLARSILKPLAALEDTARRASNGDLSARAPTSGPGELAHLGVVLNDMMDAVEQKTEKLRHANQELQHRHRQLTDARSQAATDPLTGLGNHRAFHKQLQEHVEAARQSGSSLALILLDLDSFKDVNDSRGHQAGDELLRNVAKVLTEVTVTPTCTQNCKELCERHCKEYCFRYGGDELAILVPGADRSAATEFATRVRAAIENMPVDGGPGVTASVGVAIFPESGTTAKEIVYRADMAMYNAKATGKNRVNVWGSSLAEHLGGIAPHNDHTGRRYADVVASLTSALRAKDPQTKDHAERCSWYTGELAAELGLSDVEVSVLRVASLLHDIGKIVVPDEILLKPGPLTAAETKRMRRHPADGANTLSNVPTAADAVPVILHHHERFDGTGYPHGLSGDDIPIGARILLVADAFDAMTEDRPYRKAMPVADAIEELKRFSGTQFDPTVVEAFLAVLKRTGRDSSEAADGDTATVSFTATT